MWSCHCFRSIALIGLIAVLVGTLSGCQFSSASLSGPIGAVLHPAASATKDAPAPSAPAPASRQAGPASPEATSAAAPANPATTPATTPVTTPATTPATTPVTASDPPAPSQAQPDDAYRNGAPALEPIDPLMPAPGNVPARWQGLDAAVRRIAGTYPGRMSVVAVDLTTSVRYEFRPNDWYYPASTFKLPVTICVVDAIGRGELRWDTPVTFTKADDDTVGQGGFATAPYGSQWTVRNLLDRSIISSNNVAVKMLARTLTWEGLRRCTTQLGGMVTRTEDGSTPVRAIDEAAWWLALWRMNRETPEAAANLLNPLRQVPYLGRIVAGTPRPNLVTHKFGTFPPYEHDGAIVWGDRPYLLVVLTYGGDHGTADEAIAEIAGAAWKDVYR